MKLSTLAWALFVLGAVAIGVTPWVNHSSVAACIGWNGLTVAIAAFVVMLVVVCAEDDGDDQGGMF